MWCSLPGCQRCAGRTCRARAGQLTPSPGGVARPPEWREGLHTHWVVPLGCSEALPILSTMALLPRPHLEPTVSFFSSYTSGDVRVWDTRTWDYMAPFLASEYEEDEPGMQPYVSFVRINSSLAVAAYENGK